jgi:hypothetical protein
VIKMCAGTLLKRWEEWVFLIKLNKVGKKWERFFPFPIELSY